MDKIISRINLLIESSKNIQVNKRGVGIKKFLKEFARSFKFTLVFKGGRSK